QRLADVADDAGAVLDDEAEIKTGADLLLGLQRQRAGLHERDEASARFTAREIENVAEDRDSRRPAAGARTGEGVAPVAAGIAAAPAAEENRVRRAVDGGEEMVLAHEHRRDVRLHRAVEQRRDGDAFDRAAALLPRVLEIDRVDLFDALAPESARLRLQAEGH